MIDERRRCAPKRPTMHAVQAGRRFGHRPRSLTVCALLVLAACSPADTRGGPGNKPPVAAGSVIPAGWPEGAPYLTGIITQLKDDTLRIEERPQMKGGSPKAVLTLDRATMVRGIGGAEKPRLRIGQRVSAWVGPRVLESYPIRARALAIQIVEDSTSFTKP